MPSINKCIVLLTLALSAVAANHGQHMARSSHHDIAARAPVAAPEVAQLGNIQKRGSNSKRCKARSTSSSSTSTSHSTSHTSSSSSTPKPKPTSSKKEANADTAPTTTSSSSPKWTPPATSSVKWTPTSSSKAAASSPASGGGGLTTGGVGTYFTQNGVEGACGKVNPDSAIICALQTSLYAGGKNCGKQVEITNTKNGKVVTVTVADECPTCINPMSIDLSVGAFQALGGTVDEGEFSIAFKLL